MDSLVNMQKELISKKWFKGLGHKIDAQGRAIGSARQYKKDMKAYDAAEKRRAAAFKRDNPDLYNPDGTIRDIPVGPQSGS